MGVGAREVSRTFSIRWKEEPAKEIKEYPERNDSKTWGHSVLLRNPRERRKKQVIMCLECCCEVQNEDEKHLV